MGEKLQRLATGLALLLIAGLLALVATGFVFAALYLGLAVVVTPALAALIVAAVIALLALLLVLAARLLASPPAVAKDSAQVATDGAGADLSAALASELQGLARKHALGSIGAALVAGFAIGASPDLRKNLWRLLER